MWEDFCVTQLHKEKRTETVSDNHLCYCLITKRRLPNPKRRVTGYA